MNNLFIKNKFISVEISPHGAELMSIKTAYGKEYLWQGDEKYWSGRAPVLFPFVGRLRSESYLYNLQSYNIGIHGFAANSEFIPENICEDSISLRLNSSEDSLRQYPFDFFLIADFALKENKLEITFRVKNLSDRTMPFAIGGHPGFNVPLNQNEDFRDYYLEFPYSSNPCRVGFAEDLLISGKDTPFNLEDGRILNLQHSLFDEDAIVLRDMPRSLRLKSSKSGNYIEVEFPDMPYLGLWHTPKTRAGFLCIEPWSSLPGRHGIIETLTCRSDLIQLHADEEYINRWSIKICDSESIPN